MRAFLTRPAGLTLSACTAAVALSLGALGCARGPEPASLDNIVFNIEASSNRVYVGEIVTFTVDAYNTLGRDADVRWETTGGKMTTVRDNQAVQIQFDEAGDYIVSADLYVEGDRIRSDSRKVSVSKIR